MKRENIEIYQKHTFLLEKRLRETITGFFHDNCDEIIKYCGEIDAFNMVLAACVTQIDKWGHCITDDNPTLRKQFSSFISEVETLIKCQPFVDRMEFLKLY